MNPLRLAVSLLMIPRLFLSLIFFPLIISLILVYLQLVASQIAINLINKSPTDIERSVKKRDDDNFMRRLIYGSGKPLPPLEICHWRTGLASDGSMFEVPVDGAKCNPSRLDVALHLENQAEEKIAEYAKIFNGNIEKLHLCKTCSPDVVITERNGNTTSDIRSVWGLMVLGLVAFDKEVANYYISSLKKTDQIKKLIGEHYLHISGFTQPISLHRIQTRSIIIMNIACLLIIALWLAIKAHRKVLDYFARSGALLPMVAATGKGNFYMAIWLLTLFRVQAFLLAAVPITIQTLNRILKTDTVGGVLGYDPITTLLWLAAIVIGLSFATLIASIAELKQRHHLFSFAYKYLPVLVCAAGALIWLGSFVLEGSAVEMVRHILTALPVVGIAPVLVAPILKPITALLVCHALLTGVLFVLVLRRNAHWFAAHLEEI
ncbi:MAG: hypothetical protein J5J00_11565 [Deltaproteobacteria bacterium]|nr:hypothetical protein [Deltaproteobacteria bacterium]